MRDYILALIGVSGALFGFAEFIIQRHDKKKENKIDELMKRLDGISLSQYRTEMLVMMNHYENETKEILKLAEHYFKNNGNFYMASLFAKYLKDHNIEKPLWFDETK